MRGKHISRRERRHLKRSVADLFRLLPFSFFVVVPFLELTLPFFIKFFPSMLPSTYATTSQIDNAARAQIKAKVSIAKFLQETVYDASKRYSGEDMAKFNEFVLKLRSGLTVDANDTLRFARLFKDDFTIDNLTRKQLDGLCKMLGLTAVGTDGFLRWQVERAVRKLRSDDQDIVDEGGVDKLDGEEMRAACRERGIRTLYRSDSFGTRHLRDQLNTWLELSIGQKIPITLLLLTQSFAITQEGLQAALAAAIKDMPDLVVEEASAAVEIDKRARRTLSIRIAETELEQIQNEERTEMETQVQIELERAKQSNIEQAERMVDAVKVAAGQQSLLADEMKAIGVMRRRQASASAERALERPGDEQSGAAPSASATAAAANTAASATVIGDSNGAADQAASASAASSGTSVAPLAATPAAASESKAASSKAASVEEDPYQRRIQMMLDSIEQEALGHDSTMEELVKLIDKDKDGVVTKEEMLIAANLLRDKLNPAEFERVLKALDTDGDNRIRIQELEDIIDKLEDRYSDQIRLELDAAERAKSRKVDANQSAAAVAEAAAAVADASKRAEELRRQRARQTQRREASVVRRAVPPPTQRRSVPPPPPPQQQQQQQQQQPSPSQQKTNSSAPPQPPPPASTSTSTSSQPPRAGHH
jgi:LETM1 and EF-hand domain-containing protein 1